MPKMLGFLQWHVGPRVGAGPLLAGAYCHERWGSDKLPTPIRVLHSLVTVMTQCAEPWRPPSHHTLGIARAMFVDHMSVPEFFAPFIFVDAALDGFGYRVGGVVPRRGLRSWAVRDRVFNHQEAKLQVVAWAVRLACHFGWRAQTIFTDSTAAGYQAVGLRAKTWLKR